MCVCDKNIYTSQRYRRRFSLNIVRYISRCGLIDVFGPCSIENVLNLSAESTFSSPLIKLDPTQS